MKIIDRIFRYFDIKGIKPTAFEKKIGLSNGYLGKMEKRNADIGEGILIKIIENCPDLNPEWLILGVGEMLRKQTSIDEFVQSDIEKKIEKDKRLTELLSMLTAKDKEIAKLNREIGGLEAELRILKKKIAQGPPDVGSVAAAG